METRASYVAVGTFVVVLLAALVVATIWFVRGQLAENTTRYETYFASVGSGLSAGSPVRVNGVQLGRVAEVGLDPDNPTRVRVTMDISSTAPIRSDSVASLDPNPTRPELSGDLVARLQFQPGRRRGA